MKLSTRLKILIILAAVFAVCLIAGCKIGTMTKQEYLKKNDAENQCVTYFANNKNNLEESDKGKVNGREKFDVYYKAESYIISSEAPNFKAVRSNYSLNVWYYLEKVQEDGNPYYDEDGNVMYVGREVVEGDKIHANQHLYVVATWSKDIEVEVHLASDFDLLDAEGNVLKDKDGNEIGKADRGEPLITLNFDTVKPGQQFGLNEGVTLVNNNIQPANATFLSFFYDSECEYPILSTITRPSGDTEENVKVYVKYIEGKWNVVRTVSDVVNMLNGYSGSKHYLFSTSLDSDGKSTNEINCNGRTLSLKRNTFNIEIEGNGTVLSNLTFSTTGIENGQKYAPLGTLTSASSISNLTLKDVSVRYSLRSEAQVYMICLGAEEGAIFENFVIERITLMPVRDFGQPTLDGLFNVHDKDFSYLLFGGFDDSITDAEFLSKHGGITVKNVSVKVGDDVAFSKDNYNK